VNHQDNLQKEATSNSFGHSIYVSILCFSLARTGLLMEVIIGSEITGEGFTMSSGILDLGCWQRTEIFSYHTRWHKVGKGAIVKL